MTRDAKEMYIIMPWSRTVLYIYSLDKEISLYRQQKI